jgi:hypothetical protein
MNLYGPGLPSGSTTLLPKQSWSANFSAEALQEQQQQQQQQEQLLSLAVVGACGHT